MSRTFNIVLFGDEGVGKETLIEKFMEDAENPANFDLNGNQLSDTIYLNDGNECKLCFWKQSNMTEALIKKNFFHGYVIIFDVTQNQTFENLETTKAVIKESFDKDSTLIFIFGNKSDLGAQRVVSNATALEWCDTQSIPLMYYETSGLTGRGVHEAFSSVANILSQAEFPAHKVNQGQYDSRSSSSENSPRVNVRAKVNPLYGYEDLQVAFDQGQELQELAQLRREEKKPNLDEMTEMCVQLKKVRLERSLKEGKLQQRDYDLRLAEIEQTF